MRNSFVEFIIWRVTERPTGIPNTDIKRELISHCISHCRSHRAFTLSLSLIQFSGVALRSGGVICEQGKQWWWYSTPRHTSPLHCREGTRKAPESGYDLHGQRGSIRYIEDLLHRFERLYSPDSKGPVVLSGSGSLSKLCISVVRLNDYVLHVWAVRELVLSNTLVNWITKCNSQLYLLK